MLKNFKINTITNRVKENAIKSQGTGNNYERRTCGNTACLHLNRVRYR